VTNVVTIGVQQSTGSTGRGGIINVAGGTFAVSDTTTGLLMVSDAGGATTFGQTANLLLTGGTTTLGKLTFGNDSLGTLGTNLASSTITVSTNASLYIGAGGVVKNANDTNMTTTINVNGGTLGATNADLTIALTGTNTFFNVNSNGLAQPVIRCADASGTAHNISISSAIGGNGVLNKTGSGMLTLSAGNFYTGGATLNAGILNINGSWALGGAFYGGLTFNGGTLQFATAFAGNGPGDFSQNTAGTPVAVPVTFAASATVDVNGNTVACANGIGNGGSGSLVVVDSAGGGVLNLQGTNNYNGSTIVNSGTLALGVASIKANTTVSIASGAKMQLNFAGNNIVSNLVLNGVSQAPGTYNSTTTPTYFTSGTGSLVVPSVGPGTFSATPGITGFAINGANVVLNGTNGQAGDAYYLLAGTNLTQSVSQWRTVATNVFGSNGAFTFTGTNAFTAGSAQKFYILSSTNYNP
jgi:autotransporter-associated beta strand protein